MSTELVKRPSVTIEGIEYPVYVDGNGVEVMQDLDIGRTLELARPRSIRPVIVKHSDEIGEVRHYQERTSDEGGRPTDVYYLTLDQALFIAAKCRTKAATAQLKRLIAVYMEARKGNGAAAVAMAQGVPKEPAWTMEPTSAEMMLMQNQQIQRVLQGMVERDRKTTELEAGHVQLATAQVEQAVKVEALGAKVDALAAKRAKLLTGEVHTSAVKVAAELNVSPLSFARFMKARPAMRQLQRADGRWPLERTVAKYHEMVADPNAPVIADQPRVIPSPFRQTISKYIRTFCTSRKMDSDQFGDTFNFVYDRFTPMAGYDPRILAVGRLSALDVVQLNGHLDLLMQVAHEVCPMQAPASQSGGDK